MLDTFRRRDPTRDAARPGGSAARLPRGLPAERTTDPTTEVARDSLDVPPAAAEPVPETAKTSVPPPALLRQPQPVAGNGGTEKAHLIVGPEIKLKGAEISDCDTLIVEGQVDACMDSRIIQVSEHGIFRGKVQVEIAEIRGRFEGELTAHRQLLIRAGGCVSGKVRYGKILVDEGGELSGDVAATGARKPEPSAQSVSTAGREAVDPQRVTREPTGAHPAGVSRSLPASEQR